MDIEIQASINGEHAYGGMVSGHFGHFMSEWVHRILPSRQYNSCERFVFVTWAGNPKNSYSSLPSFVREVYSFLGLDPANISILSCNTRVERLCVSESGSTLGVGPKNAYLDMLDRYTEPKLDSMFGSDASGKRLYVSRSKLGKPWGGGLCGEAYLESALAAEGYEIFHPQDHPVAVQMDQYRKAEIVIFAEGSACHGAELLGRGAIKNCILLPRKKNKNALDLPLVPRTEQYLKFAGSKYLGSMYTRNDGMESPARGTALLDWDKLVTFLRNVGAARLHSTSKDGYLAAAAEDFHRYLGEAMRHPRAAKNTHVRSGLIERFESFGRAMP